MTSSPAPLHERITTYVRERTDAIVGRFFPGFRLPAFFAGYRGTYMDRTELAYLLVHLKQLGVEGIAGQRVEDALATLLRSIDGAATETFYSFRVAESLGEFGGFEGNPVLRGYSEAERDNLRLAVDSTHIYDPAAGRLRGYPNNYWAVLARCEWGRRQLGLLPDPTVFDAAMDKVRALLFRNPLGFFDDSQDFGGRYDIYSLDTHLFLEPLWPLLDADRLRRNLEAHVRLLETVAMENGASVAWGRSIGALSVCMTMELGGVALRLGMAADRGRMAGLVAHAFEAFQGWIEDDLIRAHRGPTTEGYRGTHRLVQMTLDCLSKLCDAARHLKEAGPVEPRTEGLFPAVDELIRFDESNAGVWMFRNERFAFQLPMVAGTHADYAPFPHSPGLFENPVESPFVCGVPLVARGAAEFTCSGRPAAVEKTPGGLRLRYQNFGRSVGGESEPAHLAGSRSVEYRLDGDGISAVEEWIFAEEPDALSFQIAEAERALSLDITGVEGMSRSTVAVAGMGAWRSCWGPLRRVHQVDFTPAREVRLTWRLRPAVRVATIFGGHDYVRSLYDAMPAGEIAECRGPSNCCPWEETCEALLSGNDVFHVGWPEHLFAAHGMSGEELVARHGRLLERARQSSARIVWTMHNRRPHHPAWRGEVGTRLYEAWASACAGVIHHSEWGMDLMRAELPYPPGARHVVIPHGHFGAMMPPSAPRAELERRFGLPPCAVRFGVLGRPQAEKQTDLIVRAFKAAARADQQLIISAHPIETDVSDDPRIVLLPREDWLTRDTIAAHVRLCDALVSAHTGDTYLTSGTIADAVGVGLPMLVNEWPFFREMLGDAAFYYDGTEAGLARSFAGLRAEEVERGKRASTALQPRFAWPALASQTLGLLRSLDEEQPGRK